jgi:hypothetical protein
VTSLTYNDLICPVCAKPMRVKAERASNLKFEADFLEAESRWLASVSIDTLRSQP